ncbi:DUF302 domain-containing protein [Nocardioides sp. Root190]|uniref:DUF302 domain-containing protein n=1 Tax=Nocardioides sp. Root190 TaxID=1736488 RepID=UPI001F358211|nr:DUF302 domain-containing protein [Nocardioides sp. Root190]
MTATVERGFPETLELVRGALAAEGFGIITEIDMSATLKAKLDVEMPPQVILGACRPALAHQALLADPSIATLLPCNVVVRSARTTSTTVEAFDPAFLAGMVDSEEVRTVAADARERLTRVLESLEKEN